MIPPSGAYRTPEILVRLREDVAEKIRNGFRVARTDQPITGCTLFRQLSEEWAQAFYALEDELGEYYANGLRTGALVVILPSQLGADRYYAPGELFLTS